jgi:hypothetical protein
MVRFKHRYLLADLRWTDHRPADDSVCPATIARAFKAAIAALHGDFGVGCTQYALTGASSARALPVQQR